MTRCRMSARFISNMRSAISASAATSSLSTRRALMCFSVYCAAAPPRRVQNSRSASTASGFLNVAAVCFTKSFTPLCARLICSSR